jgi:hypothetical protein
VLRGKSVDQVAFVCTPIPDIYRLSRRYEDDATWTMALMSVVEWEQTIAHAVVKLEPSGFFEKLYEYIGKRVTLDTYWRTLIGDDIEIRGELVTVKWYEEFSNTGHRLKGVWTQDDIVGQYATSP